MLLLDTCALICLATDHTRFSERGRSALQQHRGRLFVSAITAFEIGLKHRKGKLELHDSPAVWYSAACEFHGLDELPVTGVIALRATALPLIHSDPADRLIIATAQEHNMIVLTSDLIIPTYPDVRCLW